MDLVDGEHGGRRVVDRRRQRLQRDVDDDAEGERRILFHRPFRAERDGFPDRRVEPTAPAVDVEQRVALGHEVADLRHDLDDAVLTFGERGEALDVEGEHDSGLARQLDGLAGWGGEHLGRRGLLGEAARVDLLDDPDPPITHVGEHAHRPEVLSEIAHEIDECRDRGHVEHDRERNPELRHRCVDPAQHGEPVDEREGEESDGGAGRVVRERAGNDTGSELGAGDLHGHEQDGEDEHDARECRADERGRERPCARRPESEQGPPRRLIEAADERGDGNGTHHTRGRGDPQRRAEQAPQTVALKPGQEETFRGPGAFTARSRVTTVILRRDHLHSPYDEGPIVRMTWIG